MAKEHVGEIRISKRVVRIGHEVYPLANISRVQTLRVVGAAARRPSTRSGEIIVLLVLVAAIVGAATVVAARNSISTPVSTLRRPRCSSPPAPPSWPRSG